MKKTILFLTILMILCSCKMNEHNYENIQDTIINNGFKIEDFREFDDMIVFDITSQDSTFMFTFIDDKLEFTSYHKQDVNQYITYLDMKDIYIGEVYENEKHYCNYSFHDASSSSMCNKNDIKNINELKAELDLTLQNLNLSIETLSDWAQWYSQKNFIT